MTIQMPSKADAGALSGGAIRAHGASAGSRKASGGAIIDEKDAIKSGTIKTSKADSGGHLDPGGRLKE